MERSNSSMIPGKFSFLRLAFHLSARLATYFIILISRSILSVMPSFWILTATRSPVISFASWTWPIDAVASSSCLKSVNNSSMFPLSSLSTIALTWSYDMAGLSSCKLANSFAIFSPTISGLVLKSWPNLMNVVPNSWSINLSLRGISSSSKRLCSSSSVLRILLFAVWPKILSKPYFFMACLISPKRSLVSLSIIPHCYNLIFNRFRC